jgi:hypothetical protein
MHLAFLHCSNPSDKNEKILLVISHLLVIAVCGWPNAL